MKSDLPFIREAKVKGKTVLARVDFNVTVDENDQIKDFTKIKENVETINYLLKAGATRIILMSHRSTIKRNGTKEKPSFAPLVSQIEKVLKHKIVLLDPRDLEGAKARIAENGTQLFLFDNTRLHPAESGADTFYGKQLAALADVFIYEAFASYRPETTTVVIPRYLPTYIGFTMAQEIDQLSSIFSKPKGPVVCIIGGAKTEVKVGIVRRFLQSADTVILGGGVANTFLHGWGIYMGASLVDTDMVNVARELLWLALHSRVALELPNDFIVSRVGTGNSVRSVLHTEITPEYGAFDIGPVTQMRYKALIKSAGTVVWNGPMGLFEREEFSGGTNAILDAIVKTEAKTIVGGGDTITALPQSKRSKIDHISTGGGAMLVFLESGTTPPIEAIRKYNKK